MQKSTGAYLTEGSTSSSFERVRILPEANITERQREVVAIHLQGKSPAEGARSLGITSRTFQAHLQDVRAKLGIAGRGSIKAYVDQQAAEK